MTARKKMQFWSADINDDRLVLQILGGEKTATCCPSEYFTVQDGDYHDGSYDTGDQVEVYDTREQLRCIIGIGEIYEATLGAAPEKLWRGDGFDSASAFLEEHLDCWKQLGVSGETRITAMHFDLKEIIRKR